MKKITIKSYVPGFVDAEYKHTIKGVRGTYRNGVLNSSYISETGELYTLDNISKFSAAYTLNAVVKWY